MTPAPRESRWEAGTAEHSFDDGETPVKQEEVTPTSSNIKQGWRISYMPQKPHQTDRSNTDVFYENGYEEKRRKRTSSLTLVEAGYLCSAAKTDSFTRDGLNVH